MDARRKVLRAVRVDGIVLIECDVCGPVGVLTDPAQEPVFVAAHVIEHRTGKTVVTK